MFDDIEYTKHCMKYGRALRLRTFGLFHNKLGCKTNLIYEKMIDNKSKYISIAAFINLCCKFVAPGPLSTFT